MWSAKLVVFVVLEICVNRVLSQGSCNTPDRVRGTCINIRRCEPLLAKLHLQTEETNAFLRNSACGYEGNDPKVCCPVSNNQSGGVDRTKFLEPPYCGFSNSSHKRVVGGTDAQLGDWPWIAVLGYRRKDGNPNPKWLCGGSLITSQHVLTASHCIYKRNDLYLVRVGDLVLDDNVYDKANPVTVPIDKATFHPQYDPSTYTNDIGIIKLKWSVEFTDNIRPICLPVSREIQTMNLIRRTPFVAGWGTITFKGPVSTTLQEVQIPIVTQESCKAAFDPIGKTVIDDRVICAGYAAGGKDACQGDSGGPLMLPLNFTFYAVGVVSYGWKCAEPGYPGVYTRVDKFLDFIGDNLN